MTTLLPTLRRALASPLLRFFGLGAMIFAAYAVLDDTPTAPPPDAITLDVEEARRLAERFRATSRPPTAEEMEAVMRDWALEEAMVREARALGLDRGDALVRQRLRQKMTFFAESGADVAVPDDAVLAAHMEANAERFAIPPRLAFRHVLLGQAPSEAEVAAALEALKGGADPATVGAPTLLPPSYGLSPARVIDAAFGPPFFERLAALPVGGWAGPVASAFGAHLVRVSAFEPARTPPLEAVRERVEGDWRAAQAAALRDAFAETLLARHSVALPPASEVLAE